MLYQGSSKSEQNLVLTLAYLDAVARSFSTNFSHATAIRISAISESILPH